VQAQCQNLQGLYRISYYILTLRKQSADNNLSLAKVLLRIQTVAKEDQAEHFVVEDEADNQLVFQQYGVPHALGLHLC